MKQRFRLSRYLSVLSVLLLVLAPSPAFAHDNLGGDELAVANWMLLSALVVAAMGVLALVWAVRSGQFSNVEESKYRMLELADNYDRIIADEEAEEQRRKQGPQGGSKVPADSRAPEPPIVHAEPAAAPATGAASASGRPAQL